MTVKPQPLKHWTYSSLQMSSSTTPLFGGWLEYYTSPARFWTSGKPLSQAVFRAVGSWCEQLHLEFAFDVSNVLLCSSDWPGGHYLPALGFSVLYQAWLLSPFIAPPLLLTSLSLMCFRSLGLNGPALGVCRNGIVWTSFACLVAHSIKNFEILHAVACVSIIPLLLSGISLNECLSIHLFLDVCIDSNVGHDTYSCCEHFCHMHAFQGLEHPCPLVNIYEIAS